MTKYYTYILHNSFIDKYYIGYTRDLRLRLFEHNKYKGHKSKFSKKFPGAWELIYFETFNSRSEAMTREKKIKSWKSSKYIASMIEHSRL